ncbi:MAG TPA: nodulation protein NfeD [Candidatus Binatia bacterium]
MKKPAPNVLRYSAFFALSLLSSILLRFFNPAFGASAPHVDVLTLKGIIAPFTAQYINRGIAAAETDGARGVIIEMNTPGGLMNSMDDIVETILNSRVPVVVYVSPPGARAGSAGVFITMAAHVAAMAPTTNIGAAHPVSGGGKDIEQDLRDKITNDAAARVRALASARGRNADWAEEAVRKSVSIAAEKALELKVIDVVADNLDDLLAKIDGREIKTKSGVVALHVKGARQQPVEMTWSEKFLHTITDPNIAYILFNLGTIALIAEFYHPGVILPGLTGVISLVLAFTAFGVLQPNWAGMALIVLAVILFVADLKVQGYALSVGGAVAFVLGSIMLYRPLPALPDLPKIVVSPWLIAAMTSVWLLFFVFALSAVVRSRGIKLSSGVDLLLGEVGVAKTDLKPGGIVLVRSEEWSAESVNDGIDKGEKVKVVEIVGGLRLRVTRAAS